jgi:hypothetical protein
MVPGALAMRFPKIRLRTLMGIVALFALLIWLIPCGSVDYGIGHTNLKITFIVADAITSRPVDGATIEFQEEGSLADPVVIKTTDPVGKFIREGNAPVASRRSCWETTYATSPPDIVFRTLAPGYETTAWVPLYTRDYFQLLKSDHPVSTLDVKIRLSKSPAVPTKSAERVQP